MYLLAIITHFFFVVGFSFLSMVSLACADSLLWPVGCIPGRDCLGIGYPDIDGDGNAFNCGPAGYRGHTGTDIVAPMKRGSVRACNKNCVNPF